MSTAKTFPLVPLPPLKLCYLKWGPQTSSLTVIGEPDRNTEFQAPPRPPELGFVCQQVPWCSVCTLKSERQSTSRLCLKHLLSRASGIPSASPGILQRRASPGHAFVGRGAGISLGVPGPILPSVCYNLLPLLLFVMLNLS